MIDRRTLLSSIGTGVAGVAAGGVLLTQSDRAKADVTFGELTMASDKATTADGTIENVSASAQGTWSYELPGGNPAKWIVELRVSDGDTWGIVGTSSGNLEYDLYEDSYSVSGSITNTNLFDTSFFAAPGPGKQKSVELPIAVNFVVQDSEETTLARAGIEDTATVTVAQEQINASLYGKVSGDGSVSIGT